MPGEHRNYYQHQQSSQTSSERVASGTHPRLDDFVIMEKEQHQQPTTPPPDGSSLQDVYAQLVQKERDLLLAAQLGKALLEKNEELGLQNEKMAEEYSRQLEVTFFFRLFVLSVLSLTSRRDRQQRIYRDRHREIWPVV